MTRCWQSKGYAGLVAATSVLLFSSLPVLAQEAEQKGKPDYSATTKFDFDGDTKPDTFHLEVRKERDYSYNPATQETSKEKFLWYRCRLKITSGADKRVLLEDEWSIKENDLESFRLRFNFETPQELFNRYFENLTREPGLPTVYFETSQLTESDINPESLRYSLQQSGLPKERWQDIQKEILGYPEARLFLYRTSWYEDLRWTVYVKSLKRGIHYYFGYPE